MSVAKRVPARGKKTTKKVAKKVTRATRTTSKKISKRTARSTAKASPKTTQRVTKKTTKKTTTKPTRRVAKRVKKTSPQTVREARFGGHQNTLPDNPKAPGRLLGRSFALSSAGLLTGPSLNTDAIAVAIARFGGVAIMMIGLGLSWHLYNLTVPDTYTLNTAAVIEAEPQPAPQLQVTQASPVTGDVSLMITAPATESVHLIARTASSTTVLGAAHQQTAATWEFVFATELVPDAAYNLTAILETDAGYSIIAHPEPISVRNEPEPTAPSTPTAVADQASTTVVSTSPTAAVATSANATTSNTDAPTTTAVAPPEPVATIAPTTSMPTLLVPVVHAIAPYTNDTTLVIGEGSANQIIEVLLLRANQRATTTVQSNGWWSLTIDTPAPGDAYELYAQANDEALSRPLDFSVITGRLVKQPDSHHLQATSIPASDPDEAVIIWYLLAAVATVCIGSVLLLIGHHLHYTRQPQSPELDQAA